MSVYFSNLPEYTGNTYNGYVIWNDSGETTTYKTKYQPQFIKGDASQSLVPYYFPTSAATAADTTYVDKLFSVGGEISFDNSMVIGDSGNTISTPNSTDNIILGGLENDITSTNTGRGYVIAGGRSNSLSFRTGNVEEGGGIFGAHNATASNIKGGSVVIGGVNNQITNLEQGSIVGGYGNKITTSYRGHIIGSINSEITGGDKTWIGGGGQNNITNGSYSVILGGEANQQQSNQSFNTLVNGLGNFIQNTSTYSQILNGTANYIKGTSARSTIVSGSGNTINNLNDVVILGGTGISATTSNTTYVDNLSSLGQTYNGYYDNGSGSTFTIDWNNGNSQKIFMTGDISLTFTNVKSGGQYRLQIVNGGTHSITATTASGFTILCEGGVVPNITNNGVDLCILEGMGTDLLVRHFADFSAP